MILIGAIFKCLGRLYYEMLSLLEPTSDTDLSWVSFWIPIYQVSVYEFWGINDSWAVR